MNRFTRLATALLIACGVLLAGCVAGRGGRCGGRVVITSARMTAPRIVIAKDAAITGEVKSKLIARTGHPLSARSMWIPTRVW